MAKKKSEEGEEEKKQKPFRCSYMSHMFKVNKSILPLLIIGTLCSMYVGCIFPLFSYYLSKLIVLLSNIKYRPESERAGYIHQTQLYSLYMLLISIGGYFAVALRGVFFNIWTTKLVSKLKKQLYEKLLKMSTAFYDRVGSCSAVISDCKKAA